MNGSSAVMFVSAADDAHEVHRVDEVQDDFGVDRNDRLAAEAGIIGVVDDRSIGVVFGPIVKGRTGR